MKFSTKITIDLPVDNVIELLGDDKNLVHWQRGLKSFEHLSGVPNSVGSKMKLNYVFGYKKMSLLKTITKQQPHKSIHFQFDMKGIHFLQENTFVAINDDQTEWLVDNKFIPTNLVSQIMVLFSPGDFKNQVNMYMADFKKFAEHGTSVQVLEKAEELF